MKKNCFELLQDIAYYTGLMPDYNYSSFSDTYMRAQLLKYLNTAKEWVVGKAKLDSLIKETVIGTIAQYVTGHVSITQGTTTVTGSATTFTSDMVNRKILIGSSNVPYRIIKFTNTNHIEIEQPWVEATVTIGTYIIFQDIYTLPPFVNRIMAIKRLDMEMTLNKKSVEFMNKYFPNPMLEADNPRFWAVYGALLTQTASLSADAGTTTTSIVDASLPNTTVQDFYKSWYVYNTTRTGKSRVTQYDISTTTLTLDAAITGQVATDAYYLSKREWQVLLRPTPLSVMPLVVVYQGFETPFVNDADFDLDIDGDYEMIMVEKAISDFFTTRDPVRSAAFLAKCTDRLNDLDEFEEDMPMSNLQFGQGKNSQYQLYGMNYTDISGDL